MINQRTLFRPVHQAVPLLVLALMAGTFGSQTASPAQGLQAGSPWPMFHQNLLHTGRGVSGGATSTLKWKFTTGNDLYSSPAVGSDGTIYVGSQDDSVYAINPANGSQKWKFTTGNAVDSSPAIGSDGSIYVGSYDGNLYAISSANGIQKWKFKTGGSVNWTSPAIGPDGTIYVGSEDSKVYAINSANGSVKWAFTTGKGVESSPAIGPDGTIYLASNDHNLYAIGKSASSVMITSSQNPVGVGQPITITATVSAAAPAAVAPTGTVTFLDGATTLQTEPLVTGVAALSITALSVGSHSIPSTRAVQRSV